MPVQQRDAVRTRKVLLAAAERVLITDGPAFSLDAVVRGAGVSKGGLLHHFRSRNALLAALAAWWSERFDEEVAQRLDPDDDRPGRMCRAHIRTILGEDATTGGPWVHASVRTALVAVPEVLERARATDGRRRREMAADGLHPQRVLLISRALDGESSAEMVDDAGVDPGARRELRDLLLALSEEPGPLVGP